MPYRPRATLDNPYGPQVTFRTEDVLPPPAYYVSPDDQIVAWAVGDTANYLLNLQVRFLLPNGEVKILPYQFSSGTAYHLSPVFQVAPLEGYILGALCWANNAQRGRLFVSVQVMRGAPSQLNITGEALLQGYISPLCALSYPTSPVEPTFSGRGAFLSITQPNQTGLNFLLAAPAYTLWRFCSLNLVLATSATAGNRQIAFQLVDSNSFIGGLWQATFAQGPNTLYRYGFSPGGADSQSSSWIDVAGPAELFIPAGWSLQTNIGGLDAGDQILGIVAMVEEWMGQ